MQEHLLQRPHTGTRPQALASVEIGRGSHPPVSLALNTAATLSDPQQPSTGQSASVRLSRPATADEQRDFAEPKRAVPSDDTTRPVDISSLVRITGDVETALKLRRSAGATPPSPSLSPAHSDRQQQPPPPQYPASEASSSSPFRPPPPPFSSLYVEAPPDPDPADILEPSEPYKPAVADAAAAAAAAPAYAPTESGSSGPSSVYQDTVAETKRALPRDTKGEPSSHKDDEGEPPPAYSEGSSPLQSFTYLMSAAGGAASIITQVQQGGPPINAIGGKEHTRGATRYDVTCGMADRLRQMSVPMRRLLWTCGARGSSCPGTSC